MSTMRNARLLNVWKLLMKLSQPTGSEAGSVVHVTPAAGIRKRNAQSQIDRNLASPNDFAIHVLRIKK